MKAILPLLGSLLVTNMALAQGSAFTYQGRLENAGVLAHGSYDFRPALFDAPSGGSVVATSPTQTGVTVRNGLFVLNLDFGATTFNGGERWLGLDVRTNNTGVYATLGSRQRIAPAPYAIYASKAADLQAGASLTGSVTFNPPNGPPFNVNSSTKVPNLNADWLDGLDSSAFVLKAGDTMSGSLNIANPATINFGSSTRQMLNLWGAAYGIGVQAGTLYFRSDGTFANSGNFAWYRGGTHGNGIFDPGSGGTALMLLTAEGSLQVNSSGGAGINCVSTAAGGYALWGQCNSGSGETYAVRGQVISAAGSGVYGGNSAVGGIAVHGIQGSGTGSRTAAGVYGESTVFAGNGVVGVANNGGSAYGIWGKSADGWAGVFDGAVRIAGDSSHDKPFLQLRETQDGDYARIQLQVANRPLWHISVGGGDNSLVFYNSANSIVTSVSETGILTTKVLTITGGADIAEPFEMSHDEITKGSVVVIDEQNPGKLKLSAQAYDTRVAGVVSGAGGVKPGLTLQQEDKLDGGQQVALTGRVYVHADATQEAIQPGDLLTTSDTPGHAMKVTDHTRAQGAILGKAMTALGEGKGLVLVLVTLQ
jgi:hypothetical protein